MAPRLATTVGAARLYWGDIFGPMAMGNLVQTSTSVIRRERLAQVRGFDATLVRSGVDFDFHLRTCRAGPVAYADVSTIRYRIGMADQMTRVSRRTQHAKNFLRTITPVIANDRARLNLPQAIIDETLGEAEVFVGEELLNEGKHDEARPYLLRSLRLRPAVYTAKLLMLSLLPVPAKDGLRRAYRTLLHRSQ